MRFTFAAIGATAALLTATLAAPQAHARFHAPGLSAPNPVEQVACRLVTTRVVRPSGRVVIRSHRVCR